MAGLACSLYPEILTKCVIYNETSLYEVNGVQVNTERLYIVATEIMCSLLCSIQLVRYVAECKRQARPCRISAILIFSVIWNLSRTDKVWVCRPLLVMAATVTKYRNVTKNKCAVAFPTVISVFNASIPCIFSSFLSLVAASKFLQ